MNIFSGLSNIILLYKDDEHPMIKIEGLVAIGTLYTKPLPPDIIKQIKNPEDFEKITAHAKASSLECAILTWTSRLSLLFNHLLPNEGNIASFSDQTTGLPFSSCWIEIWEIITGNKLFTALKIASFAAKIPAKWG